jgi:hypothetical protein
MGRQNCARVRAPGTHQVRAFVHLSEQDEERCEAGTRLLWLCRAGWVRVPFVSPTGLRLMQWVDVGVTHACVCVGAQQLKIPIADDLYLSCWCLLVHAMVFIRQAPLPTWGPF